jgi:hypothetical protein
MDEDKHSLAPRQWLTGGVGDFGVLSVLPDQFCYFQIESLAEEISDFH